MAADVEIGIISCTISTLMVLRHDTHKCLNLHINVSSWSLLGKKCVPIGSDDYRTCEIPSYCVLHNMEHPLIDNTLAIAEPSWQCQFSSASMLPLLLCFAALCTASDVATPSTPSHIILSHLRENRDCSMRPLRRSRSSTKSRIER